MLLVLQHAPAEGLGRFEAPLRALDRAVAVVPVFDGAPIPTDLAGASGVVSLGGEMNVDEADRYPWITDEIQLLQRAHRAGLPVLGVCLGSQLLAVALGGTVEHMDAPEIGWHPVEPVAADPLLVDLPMHQFHYHGCHVTTLPAGATRLLSSSASPVQGYRVGDRTLGLQFHLEWDAAFIRSITTDADVRPHADAVLAGLRAHYEDYDRRSRALAARVCGALFGDR